MSAALIFLIAATTPSTSVNFEYDELGRVIRQYGNYSVGTSYTYDDNSNPKTITDAEGHKTTLTYDGLDRLTQSKNHLNGLTKFEYDAGDRPTKVTDPRSRVTTYAVDGFGQVWSEVSPDTGQTDFSYTATGLLSSMVRADGRDTSYGYDGLGRLTSLSTAAGTHAFTYDSCTSGKGRICSLTHVNGSTSFTYTPQGLVASQREVIGSFTHDQAFSYDGMGRLTGIGYTGDVSVGYGYAAGKLTTMTANVSGVAKTLISGVQYEPFGPAAGWTYGNGALRDYNYDLDGRVTGISVVKGANVLQSLTYAYHPDANIKAITNAFNQISGGQFTYDELDRLTKYVTGANGIGEYTYDASGNRKSAKFSGTHTPRTDTYSVATTSNRLLGLSGGLSISYTYDDTGNVLTGEGITYTYDAFNRMKTSKRGSEAQVAYWTNALGLRTYKSQGSPNATQFVHGPDRQLAMEYDHTGWVRTHYLRIGGELVAVVRGGNIYYSHNDHLGRTEMLTNSAASRVWYANNYPFQRGGVSDQVGGFNLGLPGQYWDEETGTWYNGFRNYEDVTGRYLQSDPIGVVGGVNTYAYSASNPTNLSDPLGLYCLSEAQIRGTAGAVAGALAGVIAGSRGGPGSALGLGVLGLIVGGGLGAMDGYAADNAIRGSAASDGVSGATSGVAGAYPGSRAAISGSAIGGVVGAYTTTEMQGAGYGRGPSLVVGNTAGASVASVITSFFSANKSSLIKVATNGAGIGAAIGLTQFGLETALRAGNDCGCEGQ